MKLENKIIEVVEKKEEGNNSQVTVDDLFDELFKLQLQGHYFFRGISKHDQYFPKVFREFKNKSGNKQQYELEKYEVALLNEFSKYSTSYLTNINHYLDWVASAQHFGLPTRLIDWTRNPFTALFFSVFYNKKTNINETEEDDFYRILILDKNDHFFFNYIPEFEFNFSPSKYNDINIYVKNFNRLVRVISGKRDKILIPQNSKNSKFYKDFSDIREKRFKKLFLFSTNNSNPRIIAQEGLFEIPRLTDKSQMNIDHTDKNKNKYYRIYKIEKNMHDNIVNKLVQMNKTTLSLFPDLQNVCEYITRTTWIDDETI